eukprot:tig00020562_g11168.t1
MADGQAHAQSSTGAWNTLVKRRDPAFAGAEVSLPFHEYCVNFKAAAAAGATVFPDPPQTVVERQSVVLPGDWSVLERRGPLSLSGGDAPALELELAAPGGGSSGYRRLKASVKGSAEPDPEPVVRSIVKY